MKENFYMVGEVAKKLNVSVRTLQYYDKIGLFSPNTISDGGRRLYSDKDIVNLNKILSFKYLGFSLNEIKNRLLPVENVNDVIKALDEQQSQIENQLEKLNSIQKLIENFKEEISLMDVVDWNKYAVIVELLRKRNDNYWVVKHFKYNTLEVIGTRFDNDSALQFNKELDKMWDEMIILIEENISADSEKAQVIAKRWWDMIEEFTGGNNQILQECLQFGQINNDWQNESWKEKMEKTQDYLGQSLGIYFERNNIKVNI